jgi:hypothetical protein
MKRKIIGYLGLVRNTKREGWFINCHYDTKERFKDWTAYFVYKPHRKTKIVPVYAPRDV